MGTEIKIRVSDITYNDIINKYDKKTIRTDLKNLLTENFYEERTIDDYLLKLKDKLKSDLSFYEFKKMILDSTYELNEFILNTRITRYKGGELEDVS